MTPSRQDILQYVLSLMEELSQDWDYSGSLGPETLIFSGLGFESLDAVVLATAIQNHYQKRIPFAELFADVGQREVRDLSVDELVGFVNQHLSTKDGVAE